MPDSNSNATRVWSVDLIRGVVMALMAIDHVRVFAGVPSGSPVPSIFFTRWITHFCAPAFIFLAGTSAYFYGQRHRDLSRFLLTRGLWLVFLELTVIRVAWTFNFAFARYEMAGVIWAIGCCMIVMAGLVKLPAKAVAAIGVLIIVGHNIMDSRFWQLVDSLGNDFGSALWKLFYVGFYAGPISLTDNGPNLMVLYSWIPWIGVMAAGYGFGVILTQEPKRRNAICYSIGAAAVAVFLLLRGLNLYGDPNSWGPPSENSPLPSFLSFLNATKYPASLLFLCMTLGPTIGLIPLLETARGKIAQGLALIGRVPFFFYLLHIPVIHTIALGVSYLRTGEINDWLFADHPMGSGPAPDGYAWSLWQLYAVWAVVMIVLYMACRWYAEVKSRRSGSFLMYL